MAKAEKNKKGEINAFVGPGSELEGKLNFSGSVRIDGQVTGQISSQGLLIIGPSGRIQADVEVETIIICGEVRGEVVASDRIELRPPAKVFGTLTTPALTIHEGVLFEGNCRMSATEVAVADSGKITFLDTGRSSQAG
jgi:cytoskeletal protein CcmA (bactofilin family)